MACCNYKPSRQKSQSSLRMYQILMYKCKRRRLFGVFQQAGKTSYRINRVAALGETSLFCLVDIEARNEFVAQGFKGRDVIYDQFGGETEDIDILRIPGFHHFAERLALAFGHFSDLVGKDGINSCFRTHDGNLGGGMGQHGICAKDWTRHCVETSPITFEHNDRDFWHNRLRYRCYELSSVTND